MYQGGNMKGSQQSYSQNFQDSDIKELAYDLGVDPRILKYRL